MKSILIPVQDNDAMPAVFAAALLIARAFDSYMEGIAVRPAADSYVNVEPVSGLAMARAESDGADQAHRQVELFMQTYGVPSAELRQGGCSYGWPNAEAIDESLIGSCGRTFDLIVHGRPGRAAKDPKMPSLESALFESGRPVLVVPAAVPQTLGQNVLVAWNGSIEQARTNAGAIPLLQRAQKVTVLTVVGATTPGPSGEAAALHLRRHGIESTAITVNPGSQSPGESILAHAASLGCDLLVKGAYTQSRLRQMIFGGTTRHILANATLPVLMAH